MFHFGCRLLAKRLVPAIAVALVVTACAESPSPVAPPQDAPSAHSLIVPAVQGATQIFAGGGYNCAVKVDGQLACWGSNFYGQATPPSGTFTNVAASADHTCAVRTDQTVVCWGRDAVGDLNPPSGAYTQVTVGQNFSCGLRTSGAIACWGENHLGQSTPPLGAFTQMATGSAHGCAVAADSTLACWGIDVPGSLTPPPGKFVQVTSGGLYSCGLASDGTIICWGDGRDGRTTPPAGQFVRLGVGNAYDHDCAIRADGSLACWGNQTNGEATPISGSFTQVSAGGRHTCAVRTDGTPVCWGSNASGQTTLPSMRVSPTASFSATPTSVASGGSFGLALTNAQVPGYPQATAFTYAFDCGDGSGYAAALPDAAASCTAGPPGTLSVRGKVIDQDGDYAEYSTTVTVTQASQTVAITSTPPNPASVGGTYAVSVNAPAPGTPVALSAGPALVCTLSGTTVSLVGAGSCTVTATRPVDPTYQAASDAQTFAVGRPAQTVTFTTPPPSRAEVFLLYKPKATGGASGNPVVISSLTPNVCGVAYGIVLFKAIGTCTLAADQAGNATYGPGHAEQSFTVYYLFLGFGSPVRNAPSVNVAKAGSTVPVKFLLGGSHGMSILKAGYPRLVVTDCRTGVATGAVYPAQSSGGLTFDWKHLQYAYDWKTSNAWAGSCGRFELGLNDGSNQYALFSFK